MWDILIQWKCCYSAVDLVVLCDRRRCRKEDVKSLNGKGNFPKIQTGTIPIPTHSRTVCKCTGK
jgi:hypothetical protein